MPTVALAAVAGAVAGPLDPPELENYLRWGPLRVRPGFTLANFGYDDNIFSSNSNKVGDTTATLVPEVEGLVLFGDRTFLRFNEALEYTSYASNTDQNFLNQRGAGRLTVPFDRIGVFADFAVNHVRTRPEDREDIRPRRRENRLGAGVILELGWRTEVELSRSAVDWRYTDDDSDDIGLELDRDEDRTDLSVRYQLRGRTRLTLDLGSRDIDFDDPLNLKDTDERTAYLGIDFGEGGKMVGRARLGRANLDPLTAGRPALSETVGDLELRYWLAGDTRLELDAERLTGFTATGDDSYYLFTSAGLRGIHYLTRFLGVESGARLGRLRFPGASGGSARRDDLTDIDVGVRMRLAENALGRRTVYSLKVGSFRRDSTDTGRERTRTAVSFGAVLGF